MSTLNLRLLIAAVPLLATLSSIGQSEMYYAQLALKHSKAKTSITLQIKGPSAAETLSITASDLIAELVSSNGVISTTNVTSNTRGMLPARLSPHEEQLFIFELKKVLELIEKGTADGVYLVPPGDKVEALYSAKRQSEVLYAVADVLVDRLKEELALKYFDRMSNKMDDMHLFTRICTVAPKDTIRVCSWTELMPATQLIFKESRSHIAPQVGATLKAAFMDDLEKLPKNFSSAYLAGSADWADPKCGASTTNVDAVVLVGTRLYSGIERGDAWTAIIEDMVDPVGIPASWNKERATLDLALRILQSSMEPDGTINKLNINSLPREVLRIYTSLLSYNLKVHADLSALGLAQDIPIAAVQAMGRELQLAVQAIIRLDDHGAPDEDAAAKIRRSVANLKALLYHGGNSAAMLVRTLGHVDTITPMSAELMAYYDAVTELGAASVEGSYGRASLAALRLLNSVLPDDASIDDDLVKLITLAADIAEAKDGEVKEVFGAAILPVGSYRIKQSTSFSVSINAYVGLSGGGEFLADSSNAKFFGGVYAPIGVNLAWSRGSEKHLRASHSVLLSLIDLGTLVSYRFGGEDSVAIAPDITFANVFAPGLHYVYGIRESPISIGFGAQYAPHLRSIMDNSANIVDADAFRIGAFVAVDIPFFHLSLSRGEYDWARRKVKRIRERSSTAGAKTEKLKERLKEVSNWY